MVFVLFQKHWAVCPATYLVPDDEVEKQQIVDHFPDRQKVEPPWILLGAKLRSEDQFHCSWQCQNSADCCAKDW